MGGRGFCAERAKTEANPSGVSREAVHNSGRTQDEPRVSASRIRMSESLVRCAWARTPLSIAYHDLEWGVPVHDDRLLFEFLVLEGAQAGLSWETILRKREAYRQAFDRFQIARVAAYGERDVAELLANPGIVRNRLKIETAIANARAVLGVQREFGSLHAYLWRFVGGRPRMNCWRSAIRSIVNCKRSSTSIPSAGA